MFSLHRDRRSMLGRRISLPSVLLFLSSSSKMRACVCSILWCVFLVVLLSNIAGIPFTKSFGYSSSIGTSQTSANNPNSVDPDVNGDGAVDILDFVTFALAFGSYPGNPRWNPKCDFNEDSFVDIFDLVHMTAAAANLGTIWENEEKTTKIHKSLVAYVGGFTNEDADFVASKFDVLITNFETASTIGKVKELNPTITILGYKDIMAMHSYYDNWEEVNSHEDWFLHDTNGNRLVHNVYGWYAMDVGNAGWRTHYANYVKDKLDKYPAFDGVFADDTWDEWYTYRYEEWTVPPEDIPPEIGQRWHNDMLGMIWTVKTAIGTKLLVLNTENNKDYVDAADGKMHEDFVHKTSWDLDFFGSRYPLDQVNALADVSRRGKIFLAHSGTKIPGNPTEADLDKVHNVMIYCFASYLLGVNGEKASFSFNNIYSKDGSRGYYPEFDVPLGSPANECYSFSSVYARDFTGGKVLVNPTTSSYFVDLNSEFKTLDDEKVSDITLGPHSAAILLSPCPFHRE